MHRPQAKARGNHVFRQLLLTDEALLGAEAFVKEQGLKPGHMSGIEFQAFQDVEQVPPYTNDLANWVADQLTDWFAVIGLTYVRAIDILDVVTSSPQCGRGHGCSAIRSFHVLGSAGHVCKNRWKWLPTFSIGPMHWKKAGRSENQWQHELGPHPYLCALCPCVSKAMH